jgi:hypothetical protein
MPNKWRIKAHQLIKKGGVSTAPQHSESINAQKKDQARKVPISQYEY